MKISSRGIILLVLLLLWCFRVVEGLGWEDGDRLQLATLDVIYIHK